MTCKRHSWDGNTYVTGIQGDKLFVKISLQCINCGISASDDIILEMEK
jgi:hypothetical protein